MTPPALRPPSPRPLFGPALPGGAFFLSLVFKHLHKKDKKDLLSVTSSPYICPTKQTKPAEL